MTSAIALQVFNKPDLTLELLTSLSNAFGVETYRVYVLQDSLTGALSSKRYAPDHARTKAVVEAWLQQNATRFVAASFRENDTNLGTCKTTQAVIDWALTDCDDVIFSEDDTTFEPDALMWFRAMLAHEAFAAGDVWAVAGESKIFDSGGAPVTQEQLAEGHAAVTNEGLLAEFIRLSFLPSTCFATNRQKWSEFGATRGHPNGDRDVNIRCKEEGRFSLWPVVARVSDNGMHHPNGFSVLVHKSPERVSNKKQNIASGQFGACEQSFVEKTRNVGGLFSRFSTGWRNT